MTRPFTASPNVASTLWVSSSKRLDWATSSAKTSRLLSPKAIRGAAGIRKVHLQLAQFAVLALRHSLDLSHAAYVETVSRRLSSAALSVAL